MSLLPFSAPRWINGDKSSKRQTSERNEAVQQACPLAEVASTKSNLKFSWVRRDRIGFCLSFCDDCKSLQLGSAGTESGAELGISGSVRAGSDRGSGRQAHREHRAFAQLA